MKPDETIRQQVNDILCEEFELSPDRVHPDATLYEDLDLDSLDAVDMVVVMEKFFNVKLANQDTLQAVKTVGDLHELVIKLQKEHSKKEN